MPVNFAPPPGQPWGVSPGTIGPAAAPPLTQASPGAGVLGDINANTSAPGGPSQQGADPGLIRLAQAMMRSKMAAKQPQPGIDPAAQAQPNPQDMGMTGMGAPPV